jgi:protein-tyrosine phosphatase
VIYCPFDDSRERPSKEERDQIIATAKLVVDALRNGQHVLVTCRAGLNRSGLVTALSLMMLGDSAVQAIARVRAARGESALSNPTFVRALYRADRQPTGRISVT